MNQCPLQQAASGVRCLTCGKAFAEFRQQACDPARPGEPVPFSEYRDTPPAKQVLLGDWLSRQLARFGVTKWRVQLVLAWFGFETDCGCSTRQRKLNALATRWANKKPRPPATGVADGRGTRRGVLGRETSPASVGAMRRLR